jgi:hypothetical protein
MRLSFADAQRNVAEIANRESYNKDVLYELLAAYGRSRSAITKLREGSLNLAEDKEHEVLQRGVVYFKHIEDENKLHSTAEDLFQDPLTVRYNPRYIIVTDYQKLVAVDTKKNTRLDIKLRDIDRDVDFFYGWTGDEITDEKTEAVADRRAADKMKDLYAEIEKINQERLADPKSHFRHDLNVFFSRLLFCFFAEDTRVFSKEESSIFTSAIKDYTQTDGSDLDQFLQTLFDALDTNDKSGFTSPFSKFPYVNGTIFDTKKHSIGIPKFNAQARKLILDCGNQNWAEINPDIFGSMFQSIVDEEQRSNHGQHYTSVPNIMKTIEPLFLDGLREEFDKYYDNEKKLEQLWSRISKIKVFDPACGSGNFLIIAYKELRKIEHGIIERLYDTDFKRRALAGKLTSRIMLDNFYGIEIDDFPHEIAILSLYLAKHQMNIDFEQQFGKEIKLIPLKDNANIVHGDSTLLDWNDVCPNVPHKNEIETTSGQSALIEFESDQPELDLRDEHWDEIYLIGNPPYLGTSLQDNDQKNAMSRVFKSFSSYKNLDFIAAWFKIGADYIEGSKAQLAFVSTNSITQGQQVEMLWPYIFEKGIEIGFAHTSFKWSNGARNVAGVSVVIIGLRSADKAPKYIFNLGIRSEAENINAYLADSPNIIISKRSKQISGLPGMSYGSKPVDDGNLILDYDEFSQLKNNDQVSKYIKNCIGAQELLNGTHKWCLWIEPYEYEEAKQNDILRSRFDAVASARNRSKKKATKDSASRPYQFGEARYKNKPFIALPSVSSENREYIPMIYVSDDAVATNTCHLVLDAPLYLFGILNSKMHMAWTQAITGRLETRINYSSTIVYNNLPVPTLSEANEEVISKLARAVLLTRENHSEKTLAELYDPDKMPKDLREAHEELDLAVDRLYRSKPYNSDEERLADLFALYEQMIEREKTK